MPLLVANQMHGALDCNKCGMGSPGRDALTSPIQDAREALKPFAEIALFVEHTDQRDGEIVHRQYDREGKRVELTKDDFKRAATVYAALAAPQPQAGASEPVARANAACGAGSDPPELLQRAESYLNRKMMRTVAGRPCS